MKPKHIIRFVMMLCVISPIGALAQFDSGSTGADGPLVVTNSLTLDVPTNGVFNFTTININLSLNNQRLTFRRNALNTPVYLLATGDVIIQSVNDTAGVSVNGENYSGNAAGKGGPGGFDGGFGAFQGFPAGPGQGPGGGLVGLDAYWAAGVYAFPNNSNTNIYGNTLLSPLIGGSGGAAGGGLGGGGGGGAIVIASSTKIVFTGHIHANGGIGYGGGSGGAIRLVAPVVEGSGVMFVRGRSSASTSQADGRDGRTRIDSIDRFAHRNITLGGKGTRGSQMFVFPIGDPKLDIINAAGTAIPQDTETPVTVTLPVGSSTNQLVRVQARGFTNDIPIRVKITPENAPSATFDGVIQQSSGNPPFADVQVTLPVDTVCHVHAWTR